jgi:hypothetical protein
MYIIFNGDAVGFSRINPIFKYNLDDFLLRMCIRFEFQFIMNSSVAIQLFVIAVAEIRRLCLWLSFGLTLLPSLMDW